MTDEEKARATKIATDVLGGFALVADQLAKVPDPITMIAGSATATTMRVIQAMIAQHGPEETKRRIQALHAKRDEGAITDAVLAEDDRKAHDEVAALYREPTKPAATTPKKSKKD